ncbi:PXA domain-containing protein [Gorgonomyces haynaldii]|nr:PXA domain-containing protein [Gorgonomyces haynaldii]
MDPKLESHLKELVDYIVRDFIWNWYQRLCHSKSQEFPNAVREGLLQVFVSLGMALSQVHPTMLLLSIGQTLNGFVKEYRQFQDTEQTMEQFLLEHPKSRLNGFKTEQMVLDHLRDLSMRIAVSLLPRQDRQSPILFAVVREIVATSVLWPLVRGKLHAPFLYPTIMNAIRLPVGDENTVYKLYVKIVKANIKQQCQVKLRLYGLKYETSLLDYPQQWQQDFNFECKRKQSLLIQIMVNGEETRHEFQIKSLQTNTQVCHSLEAADGLVDVELILTDSSHVQEQEAPPLPPREPSPRSSSPDDRISLEHIFALPEGLMEFMQFLDADRARYVSLYIMVDAFKKMDNQQPLQQDAERILDTFFVIEPLDFGQLQETVGFVDKLRHKIQNAFEPSVLDPLLQMTLDYLQDQLPRFKQSTEFRNLVKEFPSHFSVEAEWQQVEEPSMASVPDESTFSLVLQRNMDQLKQQIKETDLQLVDTHPDHFQLLLEQKFEYQTVLDELQDLESMELTEPEPFVDLSKIQVRVQLSNDLQLFQQSDYILIFSDETREWMRMASQSDFQQVFDQMLLLFSRIQQHPLPRFNKRDTPRQLEHWLMILMKDPLFMVLPPLIQFVTFEEPDQDEPLVGLIRGAFQTAGSAIGNVAKKTESTISRGFQATASGLSHARSSILSSSGLSQADSPSRNSYPPSRDSMREMTPDSFPLDDSQSFQKDIEKEREESQSLVESTFESKKVEITKHDAELILDVAVLSVEELFHKDSLAMWIRQQGLLLIKMVIKKTYLKSLLSGLSTGYTKLKQTNQIAKIISGLNETLWPNGRKWGAPPEPQQMSLEETKECILDLLSNRESHGFKVNPKTLRAIETLSTVLGHNAVHQGLERTLDMMNEPIVMNALGVRLIESIIKLAL